MQLWKTTTWQFHQLWCHIQTKTSNKVHLLHTCVEAMSCAAHISGTMEELPAKQFKQTNNQRKLSGPRLMKKGSPFLLKTWWYIVVVAVGEGFCSCCVKSCHSYFGLSSHTWRCTRNTIPIATTQSINWWMPLYITEKVSFNCRFSYPLCLNLLIAVFFVSLKYFCLKLQGKKKNNACYHFILHYMVLNKHPLTALTTQSSSWNRVNSHLEKC